MSLELNDILTLYNNFYFPEMYGILRFYDKIWLQWKTRVIEVWQTVTQQLEINQYFIKKVCFDCSYLSLSHV